jgi:hypothetical protein
MRSCRVVSVSVCGSVSPWSVQHIGTGIVRDDDP